MSSPVTSSHKERLRAKLPYPLDELADLAFNFWWSWSPEQVSIFRSFNPEKWEQYHHNPVKLLTSIPEKRLAQLAIDPYYLQRVEALSRQFNQYMQATDTWASREARQFTTEQPVAYFSIEYGLGLCLPTYAGGLGILAADHLKSASDLGLPLVGVGLLYRQGYFHQRLNADGWQEEDYWDYDVEELPLELCKDEDGETLKIELQLEKRSLNVQVWKLEVGRVNLYLLDTDCQENEPNDRKLTDRLYNGDRDTRMAQEILLGIGGVKVLQRLGYEPQVYHLNEGHAAFAMLEVARLEMERTGKTFEQVKDSVQRKGVFTTHTPVPAGHDTFSPEQIDRYFSHYRTHLGLSQQEFFALGKQPNSEDGDSFNMTVLALQLCRSANGVSKINGEVCREMWSDLYPDRCVDQVPIGHITNGIHACTWTAPLMTDLYAQYFGEDWLNRLTDKQMWAKVDKIPDHEIWWRHQRLQERLIAFVRSYMQNTRQKRGDSAQSIQAAERLFDPNVLTIGFARRFSTYKRGDLIMHDPERARAIISNPERPVQIVFAGKAHPADEQSKRIIQRLIEWSHQPDLQNRVVFIEDYDMHVAEKLVQGVDVWLNNPLRPQEASGTSGQKASFNGGINCSVLDGWWYEAYQTTPDGKGLNGWAIGNGRNVDDPELQHQRDAESLYQLLEEQIIPCYYDRDREGLPRRWIAMIKASLKTIAPYFNTNRMVMEYVQQVYLQPVEVAEPVAVG
jgi:glycogen phosphorylase